MGDERHSDAAVDHRPDCCLCRGGALHGVRLAEVVSLSGRIELPDVVSVVTQHRCLAVQCSTSGSRVVALVPELARGTPIGPRLHAVATYLKTFQALSYERLQAAFRGLLGLTVSQGGLMNLLGRAQGRFRPGRCFDVTTCHRCCVGRNRGCALRGQTRFIGSMALSLPARNGSVRRYR